MLWPQRPDNWRLGAKPAQRAWVQVATAIAQFEPITVGVNHDQFENARNLLPAQVRVVEMSSNDAWMRDCGPTFVTDAEGRRAPRRLGVQRLGRALRRPLLPLGQGPARAAQDRRAHGCRPLQGAAGARGRLDPRRRRGHGPDDRGVPALARAQPAAHPRGDRAAPARLPERREGRLACSRHRPRRDQRPRRRRRLLRGPGRGAGRRHRRPE